MSYDQTCLFEKLQSRNLKLMSYVRTAKWPLTNGVGNFHKTFLPMSCTVLKFGNLSPKCYMLLFQIIL